jgi:hypothetical protein
MAAEPTLAGHPRAGRARARARNAESIDGERRKIDSSRCIIFARPANAPRVILFPVAADDVVGIHPTVLVIIKYYVYEIL